MPHSHDNEGFEVAIIGMSGRFPGARSLDEYWDNLVKGVESIRIFSSEELANRGVSPERLAAPNFVPAASIASDTDLFAASFFGYSPREAELMDPQHRLFLECAWEAIENAGYPPRSLAAQTGVFAGVSLSPYLLFNLLTGGTSDEDGDEFQAMIGSDKDFFSTRISYKLNLKGPSITVQSGCSTSLVAIHLGVQNLLTYQCDLAIAGGASIGVPQRTGYQYEPNGIVSPDGHSRAFDAQAAGTVFGEGVGVVVLKRLAEALKDRDHIQAIILGSAINNDGAAKIGFTAPSIEGQASVISRALAVAGISADTVDYVEAHGTATPLGDPVEIAALTRAFRQDTDRKHFCGVGSVKTNIGHLDAAAGVAGLLKTVLMLKHKRFPPSLHFHSPNPKIDFESSPFYVVSKPQEWASENVRRAGVSSFGIGGTNAHVVLQEAPEVLLDHSKKAFQILSLSAQTNSALEHATADLESYLKKAQDEDLAAISYTLHAGREHFSHRCSLICHGRSEALEILRSRDPERMFTGLASPNLKVAFMFPGGGTQYPGMGAELYAAEPEFKKQIDLCIKIQAELGDDLRARLYPTPDATEWAAAELARPSVGLPATFITEYALAKLLISWGIKPHCMTGHSLGEYAVACLAGVFSLKDALSLVAYRGRLLESLPSGAMLSVYLSEREARALIGDRVSIAAINSPDQCVFSGPSAAIEEISHLLSEREVEYSRLHIDAAAHCSLLDPVMDQFRHFVSSMTLGTPSIPFVSNLTGTWITSEQASSPGYWVDHLRHTVRFADGIAEMLRQQDLLMIEVGPSRNLTTLVRGLCRPRAAFIHACMRHPQDSISEQETMLRTLARIWNQGVNIDWQTSYGEEHPRRIPLPTYPFERERYWINPKTSEMAGKKRGPIYTQCAKPTAPLSGITAEKSGVGQVWILLLDEFGIGEVLRERLMDQGGRVLALRPGEQFGRDDDGAYVVRPASDADIYSAFEPLNFASPDSLNIVHLWSIAEAPAGRSNFLANTQPTGIFNLLALLRAVGKFRKQPAVHLVTVSSGIAQVSGADPCHPGNSAFAASCRVLPHEYEDFSSRVLDVFLDNPGAQTVRRIASQILMEIRAGGAEPVIAYRGFRRYAIDYEPASHHAGPDHPIALREGGVYLITGGLGELGPVLATSFARRARCKLILAGRSVFPEKQQWESWLQSHPAEDRTSRAIRLFQEAESLGSEMTVLKTDVTDLSLVQSMVEDITRRFGALHGVVHLAGVTGSKALRLLADLEETEFLNQTRPKVDGAYALAEALQGRSLDFCVLFSSTASVLGGAGMAAYAAANGFLDSFAMQRCLASGQRWISIGWDAWLAGDALAYMGSGKTALDKFAIGADEATEILHTILATAAGGHYVVSTGDLRLRIEEASGRRHNVESKEAIPVSSHSRPPLASEYAPPVTDLQRKIADIWAEVLGVDKIGLNDNLFELGGNSLIGLRIISRLKRMLNIEIPVVALFEGPTVLGLSQLLSPQTPAPNYQSRRSRGEQRRKLRVGQAS